jgi:hypothetical protein
MPNPGTRQHTPREFAPTTGTRRAHPNMHGLGRYCNCWRHYTTAAETSGAKTTLVRGFRLGYPIGRSSQFRFGVPVTRRTPQPALGVSRLALCCFYCGITAHGPTVIHIGLRRTSTSRLNRIVPPISPDEIRQRTSVPVGPILSRVDHKRNSLPHHRRFRELSRLPSPTADGRSTAGQAHGVLQELTRA